MGQQRKPKPKPEPGETTMAALAKRLGVSRQLIGKLYSRGYSIEAIVSRIEARRAQEDARMAVGKALDAGRLNGAPNGHAAEEFPTVEVPGIPSFAESERRKEHYLAEIRRAEAAKLHSELFPLQPLRAISVEVSRFQRDALLRWPEELSMELAMRPSDEIAVVLRRRVESLLRSTLTFYLGECRKFGLVPPPDDEPPPEAA
jgi:hypothetical protein